MGYETEVIKMSDGLNRKFSAIVTKRLNYTKTQ